MEKELNVLCLVKGEERYLFVYDKDSVQETLKQLGRFAVHPELTFTWYDAAVLAKRLRDDDKASKPKGTARF